MPNQAAYFSLQASYVGPDGDNVVMPAKLVTVNYAAQNHGTIDIPDATASATTYNVPFGLINVDATGGMIFNNSGQPLEVKINGAAAASQTIPNGGMFCWANPVSAGSTPILSISLRTTALQVGAGTVTYHIFGDPV